MGAKTVVKRQNIASLDRSKDVRASHKRPENGIMHQIMTDDIIWIFLLSKTMGSIWYQAPEKIK